MSQADWNHRRAARLRLIVGVAGAALALFATAGRAQDAPAIAATVCSGCHGPDGNSPLPMFPKIAGLQEQYLAKQLTDFKTNRRKSDIMAPIVSQLKPEDIAPLAAYFSKQTMQIAPGQNKRVADLGKLIFFDGNEESGLPACSGCHGAGGTGKDAYPRIAGQQSQYVMQQLKNFAAGERANDVSRFMRTTAKRISDEEMTAVAEYLAGLGAN